MNILVSVSVVTYNHGKFITKCLDAILNQQTNFEFEIILYDDASTDNTKEIILAYINKYPNMIYPIFQNKNQYSKGVRGMMPRYNFNRCNGKYIAVCEGDDYWIDNNKLQKQVDFLESNNEYSIVGGNALIISNKQDTHHHTLRIGNEISDFSLDDFKFQNNLIFCTTMFRNVGFKDFPFNNSPFGDWMIYLFVLKKTKTKAKELLDIFSAYRMHSGGVFSGISKTKSHQNHIQQLFVIFYKFRFKKSNLFYQKTNFHFIEIIQQCENKLSAIKEGLKYFLLIGFKFPLNQFLEALKSINKND
jgi:glycosyltransferase involved in cell wall biosynthesis